MEFQTFALSLLVVLSIVGAIYWAYQQGYMDPVIEKIGYGAFPSRDIDFIAPAETKED
jgi:hypothetical protein